MNVKCIFCDEIQSTTDSVPSMVLFLRWLETYQICFRDHKPIGAAIYLGTIDAFINRNNENNMEQLIFEIQHLADAAVFTFDQSEAFQLMAADGAGEKCKLYYI
jgi:hypothetical protein